LTSLLCLLFALCAFPAFAQHVRVDADMEQRSNTQTSKRYRVGDMVLIGGELGIVFAVTTDGQHGKAMSVSESSANWIDAGTWCVRLGQGWHLPSRDELRVIYSKSSELNAPLEANGFTRICNQWYWSSESYDSDRAWAVTLIGGCGTGYYNKYDTNYVRAVSAF
ncbi:MAG: DUF1566 domain-containing protein, partial [Alistipes sp.]|nr:DUF1566 domain-containing protein [Alistipes sp.]